MRTLLFLDPGHFHAALTLRSANSRVASNVHVYAAPGSELTAFLNYVDAFNSRAEDPTSWSVQVHESDQPLDQLIADRLGDVVILAGRNNTKLERIHRLQTAGFNVLADKPWLTDADQRMHLNALEPGPPFVMDIMTERFDTIAGMRKHLVASDLFGEFANDDRPAIEIGSTHHLLKRVNGEILKRPPWYFDVRVQGNGLVDIQSHMTDQAQWLIADSDPINYRSDYALSQASSSATPVDSSLYADCTGVSSLPTDVDDPITDGILQLTCNGDIDYGLRGVWVRQRARWDAREAPGGGDLHASSVRGTRLSVSVTQGPETELMPVMHITLHDDAITRPMLETVLRGGPASAWQLDVDGERFRLIVPNHARTSHESNFARVLNQFLDVLDSGVAPEGLATRIHARYALLADAWADAWAGGGGM